MHLINKRGDMTIVLLVLLVLIVSLATLFSFATNSKQVEAKILDVRVIDKLFLEQELIEFYIKEAGKKATIKTFKEFVEDPKSIYFYMNNPEENPIGSGNWKFEKLHVNLNENFKQRFSDNFNKEIGKYEINGIDLNNFNIEINKEIVLITLKNFKIDDSFSNGEIEINYHPNILLEFNLTKIGLHSFQKIHEIKDDCKFKKEINKECFEKDLKNFIVGVEIKGEDNKYSLVTLTSKKEFLFGENFESIKFSFIPE
tara:strand:+ start:372 stop:1139 length:768 start_codon:yes stop_codon:yes gene_type:complete